jgi:hypothetical protein
MEEAGGKGGEEEWGEGGRQAGYTFPYVGWRIW